MLDGALRIAWFDLKLMLRQRETILWTFLMPFVFFYFIGTVTSGFGPKDRAKEEIAVEVGPEAGFLADEVIHRLEEQGFAVVRTEDATPPRPFESYARRLAIPGGFTVGALAGEVQNVVLARDRDGLGADYDAFRVSRAVYTVLADVVAATAPADARPDRAAIGPEDLALLRATPRAIELRVTQAGRRRQPPTGFEQAVPGTMVMFAMIVLLTSGGVSLLVERREGLLRRLASAPIRRGAIVLGKWGGRVALGCVQIGFALVIGRLVFGVHWGPGLPMLCLVLLAYAALLGSIALLVGNFARSEAQAIGLAVLATNVLAALGGCWWPIEITPPFMQRLALFLPTGWAMDAIHELVSFGAPPVVVLPHVLGMAVLALLLGRVAAGTLRFQ